MDLKNTQPHKFKKYTISEKFLWVKIDLNRLTVYIFKLQFRKKLEVVILFSILPLNRAWPLNRWPLLNRGRTVVRDGEFSTHLFNYFLE